LNQRSLRAVLPCRAGSVAFNAELRRRADPSATQGDRVDLAVAQPRSAGPSRPGLPAQGRNVHREHTEVREHMPRAYPTAPHSRVLKALWPPLPSRPSSEKGESLRISSYVLSSDSLQVSPY